MQRVLIHLYARSSVLLIYAASLSICWMEREKKSFCPLESMHFGETKKDRFVNFSYFATGFWIQCQVQGSSSA